MLAYDQIPPGRRTIGDATGRLEDHNGVLGVALAQWMARDDSRAEVEVTHTGHAAVDTIDAMLRELHELRSRLVGEIREDQNLADARVDAMLARCRQERVR